MATQEERVAALRELIAVMKGPNKRDVRPIARPLAADLATPGLLDAQVKRVFRQSFKGLDPLAKLVILDGWSLVRLVTEIKAMGYAIRREHANRLRALYEPERAQESLAHLDLAPPIPISK